MLNAWTICNSLPSTCNSKNMSIKNKSNCVNQVKTINDLKKVIPRVKILGAKVNTLEKLTQADYNNKFSNMETETPRLTHFSDKKLNNYCRTCAGLKIPLVDIFSNKGIQMRLNQQMKHLKNIDKYDSLSTQMCMDCICDLRISYKFFLQIKKAEVKLKSINRSINTAACVRVVDDQSIVQSKENPINSQEFNKSWKVSSESNRAQFSSDSVYKNPKLVRDHSDDTLEKDIKKIENDQENVIHNSNDEVDSIEEFDPDDNPFNSAECMNSIEENEIDTNKDENMDKQLIDDENITVDCSNSMKEKMVNDNMSVENIEHDKSNEYNINIDSSSKVGHNDKIHDACLDSYTKTKESEVIRETIKQPNILKRKASWQGKSASFLSSSDSKAKEAKIHKLNTVNISPSDEEGIMYVTVKGSKPNELLLVKVKKMDKCYDKKNDKNSTAKSNDVKFMEKSSKILPSRDVYCDRSKKFGSREAIIEEQIEQYKKKREKLLGSGTNVNIAAAINATDNSNAVAEENTNEAVELDHSTFHFTDLQQNTSNNMPFENSVSLEEQITIPNRNQNENMQLVDEIHTKEENESVALENDPAQNSEHKNTKEYLARLAVIKQKWEEAKMKKELLQKELDESYTEGNLEKLSRILGEKEKNLQEFQEYLKQRKIVITRLKDEDIISLYEDRNVTAMHNKLPDLIDENPALNSIGGTDFLDCDYCPSVFSSRSTLEEHLKSHDYKISYFCEDCGSEFPNNKSRRAHNITCLKKLICKYCDFMLESRGKKRQHEQKHCDTIYGQLCDVCGEKFKHQGTLDQHIKTQHMSWEKIFQCPKCPKKFAFKQKLSFHLKSVHTTLRAYLCEDCGADFKNPASLRHHRIRKHQPANNKRECTVCHKLVPFYSLSKHMYTHKAYTIECPHCEKMFKNTSTLKQHVRIHEDQRQYRCDTCGVGFNRRDGLRLHMKVHEKSDSRALKECSCQICSEKFPNHSMLVIHRNRVHKDGRQYTCHICNRSMLSTRSLEWHMSHIHNEAPTGIGQDDSETAIEMKRVSCNHCDKTFKTEMILRTHIKNTHMEKNPVKCLDCDLMFTSEVRMRHHMMTIHNRLEGTLTCPHCPKRFVNQLRLKTHMISHSEDRPYTCEICGFNLKTKIQLIKHHQNRHSDERPLQCRYCPWRCKQVSALVCHERTHTNERPYSCSECKQRFKYLGDKNKHERRHESLGGSGFKRIVAGRNVKQPKNHDGEVSTSEHDLLEHDYETVDDQSNERTQYNIKYEAEQQIVEFEAQEIDDEVRKSMSKHEQEFQEYHQRGIDDEDEDEEDEEDEDEDDEEPDDYEDEEDEEERAIESKMKMEMEMEQQRRDKAEADADDVEYKQVYRHEYEAISREATEAAEVIMNMEDATVYTEEVTADNIENVGMITAEMINNQILQTGTVVRIEQQYDDGKIQVIPVMLTLPDLTDSTTEMNLDSESIMYNN